MLDPSLWFDNMTINQVPLPTVGVTSLSQFTPNTGGVTFDTRAPLPTFDLIPHGKRGSFAVVGFNYNASRPTNIATARVTLTLKEGTKQDYLLSSPNNLLVSPTINYDVTNVTMQVLTTTDGQPAKNVEIVIIACGTGLFITYLLYSKNRR
jgi:hypothetical protein